MFAKVSGYSTLSTISDGLLVANDCDLGSECMRAHALGFCNFRAIGDQCSVVRVAFIPGLPGRAAGWHARCV